MIKTTDYAIYSLLYKLCSSPYLYSHTDIFKSYFVHSRFGRTQYFWFPYCVIHWWSEEKKITVHVLSVYSDSQCNWKDAYFYTLHTRCSNESLEALHKGSNFGMVSTFPLILYFLNFTFWKKERVQHIKLWISVTFHVQYPNGGSNITDENTYFCLFAW